MRHILLIAAILICVTCGNDKEDVLRNDEILSISGLDAESYPTDPFNEVSFQVKLLKPADNQFRKINLNASSGTVSPSYVCDR
ncbi:MAG: hypothetical protein WDO15_21745 [Bacteroidota bacterium]